MEAGKIQSFELLLPTCTWIHLLSSRGGGETTWQFLLLLNEIRNSYAIKWLELPCSQVSRRTCHVVALRSHNFHPPPKHQTFLQLTWSLASVGVRWRSRSDFSSRCCWRCWVVESDVSLWLLCRWELASSSLINPYSLAVWWPKDPAPWRNHKGHFGCCIPLALEKVVVEASWSLSILANSGHSKKGRYFGRHDRGKPFECLRTERLSMGFVRHGRTAELNEYDVRKGFGCRSHLHSISI